MLLLLIRFKKIFVQIILFSLLFIKINTKKAKRKLQSSSEEEFLDGVYLIKSLDGHMNLKLINKTLYFSTNADRYQFDNFHIYQINLTNYLLNQRFVF